VLVVVNDPAPDAVEHGRRDGVEARLREAVHDPLDVIRDAENFLDHDDAAAGGPGSRGAISVELVPVARLQADHVTHAGRPRPAGGARRSFAGAVGPLGVAAEPAVVLRDGLLVATR